jgi:protein-S-isoprenylcysteine O-methyltransferase Ste14
MIMSLLKSILHNIGVLAVGFGVALLGVGLDSLLHIAGFQSPYSAIAALALLAAGFFLRVWATFHFYQKQMKVISLSPQKSLITTGPYRFSRNPLYLGVNVFIFFGAALLLGTPSGLIITALHIPLVNTMIRREEKQLERTFGEEWMRYACRTRRWL